MDTSLRRDALLSEARTILSKPSFSREDSSRAEQLMNLADRCGEGAMRLRRAKVASDELSLGIRSADNASDPTVELEFRQYLAHGQISLLSEKPAWRCQAPSRRPALKAKVPVSPAATPSRLHS
jgi:hypothetical protein